MWAGLAAHAASGYRYPVRMSPDRRYLADADGKPFFIMGDAGWSIIAQPRWEDALRYLDDRRAKGYDLILVNLIEHEFADHAPLNAYGQAPFRKTGVFRRTWDFDAPNEAYFAHADSVIRAAGDRGLAVLLCPAYLGYGGGGQGWWKELIASGEAKVKRFGRYLGNRYKDFPNIIWLEGGDYSPPLIWPVRALAEGIRETDTVHVHSVHYGRGDSPREVSPGEAWLDVSTSYASWITYPNALAEFRARPFKPSFLVESRYESRSKDGAPLRREAWRAVLYGSYLGHVYGHERVWAFGAYGADGPDWKEALDAPGAVTVPYLRPFCEARHFHLFVPDTAHRAVVSGYGTFGKVDFAAVSLASDSSTVAAYLPTPRAVTVDLGVLAGKRAVCRWYDPRKGAYTGIGVFPTQGMRVFSPPGEEDWGLACDALPAPSRPENGGSSR
jgi:hypothetical protein